MEAYQQQSLVFRTVSNNFSTVPKVTNVSRVKAGLLEKTHFGAVFQSLKEGLSYRVDRNEKLAILQHENYCVTPRVLELQIIFCLWDIFRPRGGSKKILSMVAHRAHHLSNRFVFGKMVFCNFQH